MEDLNYLFNNSLNESLFNDVLNGKVNLFESILDPVQKTRCRDIFNEDDIMHPKVKNEIKNRFYLWYKQLNSDKKIFDIVGFKMIGSSSGFQYTDSSDIDVQVIIKMHANHDFSETKKLISILPNNNNLPGTFHPINYYFVDEKDPTKLEYVENLYNLDTKEWEKKADKLNMTIPLDYIREISRFFTDGFDLAIGRYDRDKQYLIDAFKLDPEKQEISEKEKNEVIEKRLTQFQADIDSLRLCVKLAHGLNADAYSDKTPFKIAINYNNDDPRYSVQNIIYKGLDKFDYIGKMVSRFKEGNQVIDKYKKKMKNLTESYDDLFSDIINESTDELFDDSVEELNEKFETLVARPKDFFNKEVHLYRGEKEKHDIIEPNFLNRGTKLSSPRISSFWTTNKKAAEGYASHREIEELMNSFLNKQNTTYEIYSSRISYTYFIYLSDMTLKEKLLKYLRNTNFNNFTYLYEITIKGFDPDLGIGRNPHLKEYTIDRAIKPDKVTEIKKISDDFIDNNIKFYSKKEDAERDCKLDKDSASKSLGKIESFLKYNESPFNPKAAQKTEFFKNEFIQAINKGEDFIILGHTNIGESVSNGKMEYSLINVLKEAENLGKEIKEKIKQAQYILIIGDFISKKWMPSFREIIGAFFNGLEEWKKVLLILGENEKNKSALELVKSSLYRNTRAIFWAGNSIETKKYFFSYSSEQKDKININKNNVDKNPVLFNNININLTESDDIFSDAIKEKDLVAEKEKLSDIIDILKGIQYGFISKKDGSRIIDRDWIHSCRNLNDYYDVQTDPEETLKNKLGICTDQCILIKYLINKYHPEIKTQMYGMTMGPFGHCLISLDDGGKLYHLENAWNLEQGLHGSFDSEDELKEYFESLYHKHHDKDTDAPVFVRTYEDYLAEKENLNESENSISKIILK